MTASICCSPSPKNFPGDNRFALAARTLVYDESGQDLIEYALIAAFIGLGTVTGINGLAAHMSNYLNIVDNSFTNAVS